MLMLDCQPTTVTFLLQARAMAMGSSRNLSSADGTPLRADLYPVGAVGTQGPAGSREPLGAASPAGSGPAEPAAPLNGRLDSGLGPSAPPRRGTVVVLHGYCEHRGRYRHVAEHLNRQGYDVLVGDLRGHGESGGERGFVRRFADYVDDTRALLACAAKELAEPGGPGSQADKPILLGHSMGGLVALEFALAYPDALKALALSAPFLGLKIKVPSWKRGLGLVASVLRPTLRLPSGLQSADLSHDPEVGRRYDADPLVTHDATARWFTEVLAAHADVHARAGRVRVPTLMQVAGDDRIVDAAVSQVVFDRLGASDKNLTVYPGLFHEIFNELDQQRVLSDLTNWLNEHA